VPAQQRRRSHKEAIPRRPRQQPRQRGQQNPISIVQIRPVDLTAQNSDLVPEHNDLDLLGAITAPEQHHELEDATQ
jgi:hypothetical protein